VIILKIYCIRSGCVIEFSCFNKINIKKILGNTPRNKTEKFFENLERFIEVSTGLEGG